MNRYKFVEDFILPLKINTIRAKSQWEEAKEDAKIKQKFYDEMFNELTLYSSSVNKNNAEFNELQRRVRNLKDELDAAREEEKICENALKLAENLEPINFQGYVIKGWLDKRLIDQLRAGATVGQVFRGMQYRPDKVSLYYYNDVNLHWIITMVNHLQGIQDYTEGKQLLIPTISTIQNILS